MAEATGQIDYFHADVLLGPPVVRARVGYGRRAFSGAFATRQWSFMRVGASSSFPLGVPGLGFALYGAIYVNVDGSVANTEGSGREAEARLDYLPKGLVWKVPLYLSVAYRYEQFTARADPLVGGNRPERTRNLIIAGGVRFRL